MDENNALEELNTWSGVNKYIAKKARNLLKKPVLEVKKDKVEVKEIKEIPNVDEDFLNSMSKKELDIYAKKEFKIDLDRRKSKESMIEELLTFLEGDI